MRRTRSGRPGYTLVELLVVMGLIVLLATIAVGVGYSGLIGSQRTVSAADRVSGWLLISKQRALRDRAPRGVRFIGTQRDGFLQFTEAQYIEAPEPWASNPDQRQNGAHILFLRQYTGPVNEVDGNVANVFRVYFTSQDSNDFTEFEQRVNRGDYLVLPGFGGNYLINDFSSVESLTLQINGSPQPRQVRRLTLAGQDLLSKLLGAGATELVMPVNGPQTATYQTMQFGFQAQPRPLLGEPLLQLTQGLIIDHRGNGVDPSTSLGVNVVGPALDGSFQFDVLFSPSGQVLNTTDGLICLWIHDPTKLEGLAPNNNPRLNYNQAGEQVLVVVSTRSGLIATQPVNETTAPTFAEDPYRFAKDGLNNGL